MALTKIYFGTNKDIGPTIECEDSLTEIRKHRDELLDRWLMAVVISADIRLIFEKARPQDRGMMNLYPRQR